MPRKVIGLAMAILGFVLILISVASLNIPEIKPWFYVLAAGGGYLMWVGVAKYRAAHSGII